MGGAQKKTWLDIGCGSGELLAAVRRHEGWNARGIEANAGEIAFARQMGAASILQGFIDPMRGNAAIEQELGQADVVSFLNTLEHVDDPRSVVAYLGHYMNSGSYLVLEVPRHPSLASYANLIGEQYAYRHISPPQHLQIFTDQALRRLLEKNFVWYADWHFGQGWIDLLTAPLLEKADLTHSMKDMYTELLAITNKIQPHIDAAGYADQILLVARRKETV